MDSYNLLSVPDKHGIIYYQINYALTDVPDDAVRNGVHDGCHQGFLADDSIVQGAESLNPPLLALVGERRQRTRRFLREARVELSVVPDRAELGRHRLEEILVLDAELVAARPETSKRP